MAVSKVNDSFYRAFLIDHLENQFQIEDLYDVVTTLNPANEKYKVVSKGKRFTNDTHKIEIKVAYEFRTENAAKLFKTTYKNLIQKGKSVFNVKMKGNIVMLEFKDPMIVTHKPKVETTPEAQKKITHAVCFREESYMLSDIFVKTVDTMFNSGLYRLSDAPEFSKTLRRTKVNTVDVFKRHEQMIPKIEGASYTALYKTVMFQNSIKMNPEINNDVIAQITESMNSRVDRFNGSLLASSIFRLSGKHGELENALALNSNIRTALKKSKVINQKVINKKGMFHNFLDKLKNQTINADEILKRENEIAKKRTFSFRYK